MINWKKIAKGVFPDHHILDRWIDRYAYAHDASIYRLIPKVIFKVTQVNQIEFIYFLAKKNNLSVTFRASGTSLSGQAVTDGILVDITQLNKIEISKDGKQVTVEPGITGAMVNFYLKKYRRKIGPDPASIQAARMGGILANNASGMCCGVKDNAYHTISQIKAIFPNGVILDTYVENYRKIFEEKYSEFCQQLISIKHNIRSNTHFVSKIREKYKIKNTVGYALNAFLDEDHPADIVKKLLIGSEGTLGFIESATLNTIPDDPYKLTTWLTFENSSKAIDALYHIISTNPSAIEFLSSESLNLVKGKLPNELKEEIDSQSAGLLVEWGFESLDKLTSNRIQIQDALKVIPSKTIGKLFDNELEQQLLWKIRKELFPSIGAQRQLSTSVIIEDVAVPLVNLKDTIHFLENILHTYKFPSYLFGHAMDGNLHFVISADFSDPIILNKYELLMKTIVDAIVHKFNGSIKAEHGTGRNMAPFVATEWGSELYEVMKKIKEICDPNGMLNKDVIISDHPTIHLEHIKNIPILNNETDLCVSCGFCEPVCPSRSLSLTPRQRISVLREVETLKKENHQIANKILSDFQYDGIQTCAVDGLCATSCPVHINTGNIIRQMRQANNTVSKITIGKFVAANINFTSQGIKYGLPVVKTIGRIFTTKNNPLNSLISNKTNIKPIEITDSTEFIYFPTCVTRTFSDHHHSIPHQLITLSKLANIHLSIPKELLSSCCGTPFYSKGFVSEGDQVIKELLKTLGIVNANKKYKIIVDTSPCTHQLQEVKSSFEFIDSLTFINDYLLPNLGIENKLNSLFIHTTCSTIKMKDSQLMLNIGNILSNEVIQSHQIGCCGMAGDRGLYYPELPAHALEETIAILDNSHPEKCMSSSLTCQSALTANTNQAFYHVISILYEMVIKK